MKIRKSIQNKKAITMTLAVVLFMGVILAILAIHSQQSIQYDKTLAYRIRGDEFIALLDDIERDFIKGLNITMSRTAIAGVNKVIITGVPMNNSSSELVELVLNGTLNNINQEIMINNSLSDWVDSTNTVIISAAASSNLNINQLTVKISPYDSWNIIIQAKITNVTITDDFGHFTYQGNLPRDKEWTSVIYSLENLEDPMFMLNTNGFVARFMVRDTNDTSVHGDTSLLNYDIQNKRYHTVDDGPSFMERLEGKTGNSYDSARHTYYENQALLAKLDEGLSVTIEDITIGLETFIDIDELLDKLPPQHQSLITANQTVIDHLYFGPLINNTKSIYNVTDTSYSWFKLDTNATTRYGLNASQLY